MSCSITICDEPSDYCCGLFTKYFLKDEDKKKLLKHEKPNKILDNEDVVYEKRETNLGNDEF